MVGISKDTFLADNTSAIAFKATIASLIPGINPENVIINNVTEIVDPVRNRRFLLLKLISTTAGTAQIAIDYSLVFDVQNLGGNVSPIDALKKVNETLTNSITSGEFQQVLQNTAVSMNSAALTSVVPGSMSVSPTVTATVTRTPRPSTYPTVTPQDVSTNSNGDGKLSRDHLIMAIVIPISFVLVALMTAGVAYVLFNTYGMMLMFANTDGKTKKTSGSRGIPNREASTVVSYDNIYGGDEEDDFNNKYTVVSISDVEATL